MSWWLVLTSWVCVQAIDLIDEAGSRVRLRHAQLPEEARELDKELRALLKEKDAAVRGQARALTPRRTDTCILGRRVTCQCVVSPFCAMHARTLVNLIWCRVSAFMCAVQLIVYCTWSTSACHKQVARWAVSHSARLSNLCSPDCSGAFACRTLRRRGRCATARWS